MRQTPLTDPLADHSITMTQVVSVIRRRWWIVLLLPIVAVLATWLFQRQEPYQSTVRAIVSIPGDTEDPGNSERPELMVLDDLPPFVRSHAFARLVHDAMPTNEWTVDQIGSTLDGSRYSRILTVTITNDDADMVRQVASGVELALPGAVDAFLMPDDGPSATVRIIDPPTEPTRQRDGHWLQLLITAALGVLIGSLIAIAIGSRDVPVDGADQPEPAK